MRSSLTNLYNALNLQFFGSGLPPYRVRHRPSRWPGQYGECDDASQTIHLSPNLSEDELRQALLHEMCHIGTPGHGVRFRAKLLRLARMGEAWAEIERAQYEEASRITLPLKTQIRHTLQDIAVEHPGLRWPQVLRMVSAEVCKTPGEIRRIAPWAQRVWKRLRIEQLKS